MKLVSLNLWGGRLFEPLMGFLREQSADTDIFCFQEVYHSTSGIGVSRGTRTNLFEDLSGLLADFQPFVGILSSGHDGAGPVDFDIAESNVTFVRKSTIPNIDSSSEIFIRGERRSFVQGETLDLLPGILVRVEFLLEGKRFMVVNVYGTPMPGHKLDTPERIRQSEIIKKVLETKEGMKIVCGDFNLLPDTQSIAMIEEFGMANLIKKYGIGRTRSRASPFWGKPDFQKFADYTFVSPDVRVKSFSVPDVEVSDHLPMILEFS